MHYHWFAFLGIDEVAIVKARREREMRLLAKKEQALVRDGKVLQAAQLRRRIEYLDKLNRANRPGTRYIHPSKETAGPQPRLW